ncbi:MAG: thioesterase domain-containing protein [Ruminococcus sp.]|nr:thioesterase domain-containing protein [Ruminococcus sp.]
MNEKWFAHSRTDENTEANLLLFTYAGGNATNFAQWKSKISDRVSVYPVVYAGRGKRLKEKIPNSIYEFAEQFVKENAEIFQKKFIMFSHCTGALMAYEVFRCAKKQLGVEPTGFLTSCSASPNYSLFQQDIRSMDDEGFLKLLIDTNRIDEQTAKLPNFCEYYLPILKKDFIMVQNYKVNKIEKLKCFVSTVTASQDTLVKPNQIADWQSFSETRVHAQKVVGEHFYLEKNVPWVSKYVNGLIDECLA